MKKTKTHKINVLKAIIQTIENIKSCWKTLLLFAVISITMGFALEMILLKSGFMSFLGGFAVGRLLVYIIKLLYIMVIIKTTSNIMKGESTHPMDIFNVAVSKIGHILFQVIICCGFLVLPLISVFVLLIAITDAKMISSVITYIMLGLLCVKIIFSVHGVLVSDLDALEGIKESISITKGNFFKLLLTIIGLWLLNYAIKYSIGLLVNGDYITNIVTYITTAFMTIIQVTLLTSMYHQRVYKEIAHQPEPYGII